MSIIQRIDKFKDSESMTNKAFCALIGITEGAYSNAVKRNSNIGSDILEKILKSFPDINIEWLVTGSGSMVKHLNENNSTALAECMEKKNQLTDLLIEKEGEIKRLKAFRPGVDIKQ